MTVRAEIKTEAMTFLVELEETGEMRPPLWISAADDFHTQGLFHALKFLRFHKLSNAITCPVDEGNDTIERLGGCDDRTLIAQKLQEQ